MYKTIKNRILSCKIKKVNECFYAILVPLLFGLFPLLFLFANNAEEMMIQDLFIPITQVIVFALIVTTIIGFILKNFFKSALITAFILFSYFSSGHVLGILPVVQLSLGKITLHTGHFLFIVWFGVIVMGIILIIRIKQNLLAFIQILLIIGTFLITIQVVQAGAILISRKEILVSEDLQLLQNVQKKGLPDVYYIVVDAYGRSDILSEIYGVDNSQFISFIKNKGFYVPDKSYSHYCQTIFSLGSVLNMDYVDTFGDFNSAFTDRMPVSSKLRDNQVVKYFKGAGYSTAAFASGYSHTELTESDVFFKPSGTVSEFENVLLSTTMFPVSQTDKNSLFAKHRKRILYILDKIPKISEIQSPKFIFAHIISPHPPFVFDENGQPVQQTNYFHFGDGSHFIYGKDGGKENYLKGYAGQVKYITTLLKIMVEQIFEKYPENKPVIIIQADHGPGSGLMWGSLKNTNIKERFSILNAYYFPDYEGNPVYDNIDPINMFRVLFNTYLNTRFALLPRKNFYTRWDRPYDFQEVTDYLSSEEEKKTEETREYSSK